MSILTRLATFNYRDSVYTSYVTVILIPQKFVLWVSCLSMSREPGEAGLIITVSVILAPLLLDQESSVSSYTGVSRAVSRSHCPWQFIWCCCPAWWHTHRISDPALKSSATSNFTLLLLYKFFTVVTVDCCLLECEDRDLPWMWRELICSRLVT
jgi:hypothetical protein